MSRKGVDTAILIGIPNLLGRYGTTASTGYKHVYEKICIDIFVIVKYIYIYIYILFIIFY